ncbi:MAG: sel1 repeat family protein, partial [Burkholderiales bacterium]|nr:sel1 repeat family protein [Burkholderiales bacterium]
LYQMAANQGYAKAQYNLGLLFVYGQGVNVDLPQAYMWLSLAATSAPAEEQITKSLLLLETRLNTDQVRTAKAMIDAWNAKKIN